MGPVFQSYRSLSSMPSCFSMPWNVPVFMAFDNGGFPVDLDAQAGGGQHPSPHEILDSALAACTVLTLQLYAKRKGMKLSRVTARVSHRQDGAVYRMQLDLAVEGDLSDTDRQSLLRIAQVCPVHQTLVGEVAIDTSLN
jgi:putative redox protein